MRQSDTELTQKTHNYGIIVNEDGNDSDSRIEGSSDANLFVIDAGLNFIAISHNAPDSKLHLEETYTDSESHPAFRLNQTWGPSTTSGSQFPVIFYLGPTYDTTHSPSGGFMSGQRIFGTFADSGTLNWRGLDMRLANDGAGTIGTAEDIHIRSATNGGGGAITTYRAIRIENQTVAGTNYGIYAQGADVLHFYEGDVRIGADASGGKLFVRQEDTSGALPALYLDQNDISEEIISFEGESAAGSADMSLVDPSEYTTPGSIAVWIKSKAIDNRGGGGVGTIDIWIPGYAIPTA